MSSSVPIGEFSRMTHLTVKALRHYQDVGLLAPDAVDPGTGYRRYTVAQVPTALLIGRLRALDLPVPAVREVLEAPSTVERDAVLAAHLDRMERELERTRSIVASLRDLLVTPRPEVSYRTLPPEPAMAIRATVVAADIEAWSTATFTALGEALGRAGITPAGPGSATYGTPFFTDGVGEVTAFIPVAADAPVVGGPERLMIPGGRYAVAVHAGPYRDLDRSYAALGAHVAGHAVLAEGPIRERYLIGPPDVVDEAEFRTEICWPIAA